MSSQRNEQTTGKQTMEELMIRYFVAELSPEERVELEDRCFAHDELFEELQAIEAELMDDYASGALQGRRREKFAQHLRNSAGKSRELKLAQLLTRQTNYSPEAETISVLSNHENSWTQKVKGFWLPFRSQRQVGFAALIVVVATAGLWLFWWERQSAIPTPQEIAAEGGSARITPSPQLLPSREQKTTLDNQAPTIEQSNGFNSNESKQSNREQTAAPRRAAQDKTTPNRSAQKAPPRLSASALVSITLTPGIERSAGKANELRLSQATGKIRLRLLIETGSYQSYEVVVRSVSNREMWRQSNLSAFLTKDGKTVTFEAPISKLSIGTLLFTLYGTTPQGQTEEVHSYVLYVSKA